MRVTCRTCGSAHLRIEEKDPDTSKGLTLGGIHRCLSCGKYWEVSTVGMFGDAIRTPTKSAPFRGVTSIVLDL